MHRSGVVHNDIKPANILLMNPAGDSAPLVPKLCDFGLATEHLGTMANTMAGTQAYMAPEVSTRSMHELRSFACGNSLRNFGKFPLFDLSLDTLDSLSKSIHS